MLMQIQVQQSNSDMGTVLGGGGLIEDALPDIVTDHKRMRISSRLSSFPELHNIQGQPLPTILECSMTQFLDTSRL